MNISLFLLFYTKQYQGDPQSAADRQIIGQLFVGPRQLLLSPMGGGGSTHHSRLRSVCLVGEYDAIPED